MKPNIDKFSVVKIKALPSEDRENLEYLEKMGVVQEIHKVYADDGFTWFKASLFVGGNAQPTEFEKVRLLSII